MEAAKKLRMMILRKRVNFAKNNPEEFEERYRVRRQSKQQKNK